MEPPFFSITKQPLIFIEVLKKLDNNSIYNLALSCKKLLSTLLNSHTNEGNSIKKFLWNSLCNKSLKQLKADEDVLISLNPDLRFLKKITTGNEMIETIKLEKSWNRFTEEITKLSKQKPKCKITALTKKVLSKFWKKNDTANLRFGLLLEEGQNTSSEEKSAPKTEGNKASVSNLRKPLETWIEKKKLKALQKDLNSYCKAIPIHNSEEFFSFCEKHTIPRSWFKSYIPKAFMFSPHSNQEIQNFLVRKNIVDRFFIHACQKNNLDWVRCLIDQGADINEQKMQETSLSEECVTITTLYTVIKQDFLEIAKELLNVGTIDVNAEIGENQEFTPATLAIDLKRHKILKLLVKHQNIDLNLQSKIGIPLILACQNKDPKSAKILVESKKANIDITDSHNRTPLMYATWNDCPKIVKLLIKNNSNTFHEDDSGQTAYSVALEKNDPNILNIFKQLIN